MRYSITAIPSPTSLSVTHIGFSDDMQVTHWGPGKRDNYIIHYVTDGEGVFNGHIVKRGQGFVKKPDMFEHYYANPENPWSFFWIIASGDDMEKLLHHLEYDPDTFIFNYSFIESIKKIQDKIIMLGREIVSPFENLELFYELFKNHEIQNNSINSPNGREIYLNYSIHYIETHYWQKITVNDLTEKLGISQPYLFRLFMDRFGKSPKQYINDFRLTQAKILLEQTDLSIAQIAESVGYDDSLAFSKFFSTHTGLSPSAYKNSIK